MLNSNSKNCSHPDAFWNGDLEPKGAAKPNLSRAETKGFNETV
jgi:hypothetical protein